MKRVTRDDFNITGKVFFKRRQLRSFTGSLPADYGADLGGGPIFGDDLLNKLGLDTVDDPIACSGNEMTIGYNIYSFLPFVNHVHQLCRRHEPHPHTLCEETGTCRDDRRR